MNDVGYRGLAVCGAGAVIGFLACSAVYLAIFALGFAFEIAVSASIIPQGTMVGMLAGYVIVVAGRALGRW